MLQRACTPIAIQIADSASATPSVTPPVSVPSSCQLGASTAVRVAASARGGDSRGVGSETVSARSNQAVGDRARQRQAERADPTGAQQSTADGQQREQLGERRGHETLRAARHQAERAHHRQVVTPLPGGRRAQHRHDQRHRERQLAVGSLQRRLLGRGRRRLAHRPWLSQRAKKAQFSDGARGC